VKPAVPHIDDVMVQAVTIHSQIIHEKNTEQIAGCKNIIEELFPGFIELNCSSTDITRIGHEVLDIRIGSRRLGEEIVHVYID
jgi:hypothetical protein